MDLRSQKKKLTEERLRKGDEIESILNQAQKENRDTTELEAAKVDKLLAESESLAHRVNNLDSKRQSHRSPRRWISARKLLRLLHARCEDSRTRNKPMTLVAGSVVCSQAITPLGCTPRAKG